MNDSQYLKELREYVEGTLNKMNRDMTKVVDNRLINNYSLWLQYNIRPVEVHLEAALMCIDKLIEEAEEDES